MTDNLLDQNKDQGPPEKFYEELVGAGKKFSDQEALAKGKWDSDQYIRFKEAEFDKLRDDYLKLREDYNARAKVEELIDQIQIPASSKNTQSANEDRQRPAIDSTQIESLVSNKIREFEVTKKQEENF